MFSYILKINGIIMRNSSWYRCARRTENEIWRFCFVWRGNHSILHRMAAQLPSLDVYV